MCQPRARTSATRAWRPRVRLRGPAGRVQCTGSVRRRCPGGNTLGRIEARLRRSRMGRHRRLLRQKRGGGRSEGSGSPRTPRALRGSRGRQRLTSELSDAGRSNPSATTFDSGKVAPPRHGWSAMATHGRLTDGPSADEDAAEETDRRRGLFARFPCDGRTPDADPAGSFGKQISGHSPEQGRFGRHHPGALGHASKLSSGECISLTATLVPVI